MVTSATADDKAMQELAETLLERTRDLDLEGMRALFAPAVVFWSNVGQVESALEERMTFMALEKEVFEELRIDDVRIEVFEGGYVQQCVFSGAIEGGTEVHIPTCLVIRAEHGRVTRFEEYVSLDQIQPVVDAIMAHLAAQAS